MAAEDDMKEDAVASLIFNSLDFNQSEHVLSPEDVAWVDSCLIKDPEISEYNWNSLKDALLEIFNSEPDSIGPSAAGSSYFSRGAALKINHASKEAETAHFPERTDNDFVPMDKEEVNESDDIPVNEGTDAWQSQSYLKNAFLPNYRDELRAIENTDPGLDFGFPVYEMEPSSENIFKVWDIDIPEEEGELLEQLNKALAANGFQSTPSGLDASRAWRELGDEPIDDLIAGIADLSLNRNSG